MQTEFISRHGKLTIVKDGDGFGFQIMGNWFGDCQIIEVDRNTTLKQVLDQAYWGFGTVCKLGYKEVQKYYLESLQIKNK